MDDFGDHLKSIGTPCDFEPNSRKDQKVIADYILKHFKVWVDQKKQTVIFKKFTSEDNVVRVYFEIKQFKFKWLDSNLKVKNTILFIPFDNQKNIVRIDMEGNNRKRNLTFDKDDPIQELGI